MLDKLRARAKGWRTVIFHGAVTVAGIFALVADYLKAVDWTQLVSAREAIFIGIGLGVAGIVLRAVTDTKMGCG